MLGFFTLIHALLVLESLPLLNLRLLLLAIVMAFPLAKRRSRLWLFVSSLLLLVALLSWKRSTAATEREGDRVFTQLHRRDQANADHSTYRHHHDHQAYQHQHLHGMSNSSQLVKRDDEYSCKKGVPCKTEACCGSFLGTDTGTCGFGPTFCGSDCDSQCDAKPECGQYADPPGKSPWSPPLRA